MSNYILNTFAGDHFNRVLTKAKEQAIKLDNQIVEFDFNGVTCLVDKNTDETLLGRDYSTALKLGWESVGPTCDAEYSAEVLTQLEERAAKTKADMERYQIEQETKQLQGREKLNKLITGVNLELSDEAAWNTYVENNKDGYGGRCVSYSEEWGKLMQVRIASGSALKDIAKETSDLADYDGITGFMYGAAVSMLSKCWKHGEALKKWHNKECDYEGDGVVNPAILTIS